MKNVQRYRKIYKFKSLTSYFSTLHRNKWIVAFYVIRQNLYFENNIKLGRRKGNCGPSIDIN